MTGKSSEIEPEVAPDGPGRGDFPLRPIDGQLVIVGVTSAVERLARAARAIALERKTLENAAEASGSPRHMAR